MPSRRALRAILAQELANLCSELPPSICVAIGRTDVEFARETFVRRHEGHNFSRALRQTAAGIAWERAVSARVRRLVETHDELELVAERWRPARVAMDLDLIVEDRRKSVTWILDAKLASPDEDQVRRVRDQIRLLNRNPHLTRGCPTVIGLIVHHRRQLHGRGEHDTEYRHILRCTVQEVGDLLLARQLPHWH
jgi:plasmid stabilization system protein ParE